METVNFVNYKVYMDNKSIRKKQDSKSQVTQDDDHRQYNQRGVYVRDDHCDWGSSGMNDFTNEYSESK